MDRLRTPFLIIAVVLVVLIVLIELASLGFIGNVSTTDLPTPGLGIAYLALVDGIVLFTLGMFGLALAVPARVIGTVQGVVTFISMLLLLIASIVLIFVAITFLMLMVTLFLAVPFGTIAYFAAYADFDVGPARATLGVLMLLKVATVVCIFLAQQHFLEVRGLVMLFITFLVANLLVSFLHGIVPMFLVSILDAIAAIIVAILGAVWALTKLIGSIPGIVKGLRVDRHLA